MFTVQVPCRLFQQ